uniref:Putative MscS Mechanosensitive ion channel n=1 Tax=Magnetococcus massalia (strain MO-1) TaxID=451514 RepID=A0A1S7LIF4_MAGMO|nr:putative MscS Mechanosensitive ion channel [Candidatus Magnetococcus massalia]
MLAGGYSLLQQIANPKPKGLPLHIAVVGPLHGKGSDIGTSLKRGVELRVDEINAEGGINGRPVVIDYYDDRNIADRARQQAEQIASDNKAMGVIGHWYSSSSMAGADIYKTHKIPAISPGSTHVAVTQDNPWYFRAIFNDRTQGQFLANYARMVLKKQRVAVIHEDLVYGRYLADVFTAQAKRIGLDVIQQHHFKTEDSDLEARLDAIVAKLGQAPAPDLVFLSTHAQEGAALLKRIRAANLDADILGPDALASKSFLDVLADDHQERENPGILTDGVMITTPLIFATANERAQNLRETYLERYSVEPDWRVGYAYDAAHILLHAIASANISPAGTDLSGDRKRIRNALAAISSPSKAVNGVTGPTFFDSHGDANKTVLIGTYEQAKIISAQTQLQSIRFLNRLVNLEKDLAAERIVQVEDQYTYRTNVIHTGVRIEKISELNDDDLSFKMDFQLWFRHRGALDVGAIEFLNAIEPIKIEKPIKEKLVNGTRYRLYQLSGHFKADFLSQPPQFGKHVLGLAFRHRDLTMNHLIFVADLSGMMLEDSQEALRRLKQENVLSSATGWSINRYWASQEVYSGVALGDPELMMLPADGVAFSRMNVAIRIQENQFSLRDIITQQEAQLLQWLGIMVLFVTFILRPRRTSSKDRGSRWVIPAIAIGSTAFLISSELLWMEKLANKLDPYMLGLIAKGFDILWWVVPVIFLVRLIEVFVWSPLEQKAGHTVPILVRNMVAFVIYLLAFFGIIAFVFSYALTGLLATSGVVAMIIGMAVQMNISNIFSGIALNIERPFKIGDCVKIGSYGPAKVADITWRATHLYNALGHGFKVPNSMAAESAIRNFSRTKPSCDMITVCVAPEYDPERISELLFKALKASDRIIIDDKYDIIQEWGPYDVMHAGMEVVDRISVAKYWVWYFVEDYNARFDVSDQVWREIWKALTAEGIHPSLSPNDAFSPIEVATTQIGIEQKELPRDP